MLIAICKAADQEGEDEPVANCLSELSLPQNRPDAALLPSWRSTKTRPRLRPPSPTRSLAYSPYGRSQTLLAIGAMVSWEFANALAQLVPDFALGRAVAGRVERLILRSKQER